mgnify:FL=1|tara:strand:+ start:330 stop:680 length:351 start_codon:yes stop_codon:yes gene_type:complete
MEFLDEMLGPLIAPRKRQKSKLKIEEEREDKKYYMRLKRLCKKHGITYKRDLSYWDFSQPIGTIGASQNVYSYETAYDYVNDYYNMTELEQKQFKQDQIDNDPYYSGPTVEELFSN